MNNVRTTLLEHDGGGWLRALRFAVLSVILLGLAFPVLAALLGQALFPAQARGSLIERDGIVVGSSLVAQPFADARYFQPRPSAANYDPKALAGSNWAPSNPQLRERIAAGSAVVAARAVQRRLRGAEQRFRTVKVGRQHGQSQQGEARDNQISNGFHGSPYLMV